MVSVVGTLPLFPARITMTGWRVGRAAKAMMMSLGPSCIPFSRSVFTRGGGTLHPFFLPPAKRFSTNRLEYRSQMQCLVSAIRCVPRKAFCSLMGEAVDFLRVRPRPRPRMLAERHIVHRLHASRLRRSGGGCHGIKKSLDAAASRLGLSLSREICYNIGKAGRT